jgi:hypothetical protein
VSTAFHAKLWAHNLRLAHPRNGVEALSRSIGNARVDLNPHQVDAALFALRSPYSKGERPGPSHDHSGPDIARGTIASGVDSRGAGSPVYAAPDLRAVAEYLAETGISARRRWYLCRAVDTGLADSAYWLLLFVSEADSVAFLWQKAN